MDPNSSRPQLVQNNYYLQNININMTSSNDQIPKTDCIASSTSQKHINFVSEPFGEKRVDQMPGIGSAYAQRLTDQGFSKAYQVEGQYLVMEKQKEPFIGWLKDTSGANTRHAEACYNSVSDYTNEHM